MATKPKTNVISFRARRDLTDEEELPISVMPTSPTYSKQTAEVSAVDLSGKPKVLFLVGAGKTGKTTIARYIAEVVNNKGGAAIFAAADPQTRALVNYLDGVAQPDTTDAASTARWLEALLRHLMAVKESSVIDLGGGDTSLQKLLEDVPDLVPALEEAGVAPVAIYTLGPRVQDLSSLGVLEKMGFRPAATALVCNEGVADPLVASDAAFARIKMHSAYRGAVERGAVEIWMPRLDSEVAQDLESKRISFGQARDAISPDGRRVTPLAPFDRSRVRRWLNLMATEMAPIQSWLP
jgi:hypothetical protein